MFWRDEGALRASWWGIARRATGVGGYGAAVSGSSEGGLRQPGMSFAELVLVGAGGGHGELDAANAARDDGADLEEREADGAAGGLCEPGAAESDAA